MSEILSIVNIDPMEAVRVFTVLAFLAGAYSCWVMQLYTKPTPEVEPDMPEVIYELIDTLDPKRVRWEWNSSSELLSVACNETFKLLGCYGALGASIEPTTGSIPVEELQRYRFVPKAKEAPLEVGGLWSNAPFATFTSNSGTVTAKGVTETPPETPPERDPVEIVKSRDEFGPDGDYRVMQTRYGRNTVTLKVFRGKWSKDVIGTIVVNLPARTLELWGRNYATIAQNLPLDDPRSFGSLIEEYNDTL